MSNFKNYLLNKMLLEAKRGHNPKQSYLIDEEDLDFLYQIDQDYWTTALYQRCKEAWKKLRERQKIRNKITINILKALRSELPSRRLTVNSKEIDRRDLGALTKEDFIKIVYEEAKKYDDYGEYNGKENEKPKLKKWFEKSFKKYDLSVVVNSLQKGVSGEKQSAIKDFIYYISEGIVPLVKEDEYYSIKGKKIKFYINRLLAKLETDIGDDSGIKTKLEHLSAAHGKKDEHSFYFDPIGKYGFDLSKPVRKATKDSRGDVSYEYSTSGFTFPSSNTVRSQLNNLYSLNYHRHFGDLPSDKEPHEVTYKIARSGAKIGGSVQDQQIYKNIQNSISNEIKRFIVKNKSINWRGEQLKELFEGSPFNPEKEKEMMMSGVWFLEHYSLSKLEKIFKGEWEKFWEYLQESGVKKLPSPDSDMGKKILEWVCEWSRIADNVKLRNIFADYFAKERAAKILDSNLVFSPQILDDIRGKLKEINGIENEDEKKTLRDELMKSQLSKIDRNSWITIAKQLKNFSYFDCPKCGKKWICPSTQSKTSGKVCPCFIGTEERKKERRKEVCSECGQEVICKDPALNFLVTGRLPYRVETTTNKKGKEEKKLKIGSGNPFVMLPFKKLSTGAHVPLINKSTMLKIDRFSEKESSLEKYKEFLEKKIKEKGLNMSEFNLDSLNSLESLSKIFEDDKESLKIITILSKELTKEKLTTSRSSVRRTPSGEETPIEKYFRLAGKGHGEQGVRTAGFRPMLRAKLPGNLMRRKDRMSLVKIFPFKEQGDAPNNSKIIQSGGRVLIDENFWNYYTEEEISQIEERYTHPAKKPMKLVNASVIHKPSGKRKKGEDFEQKDKLDIIIGDNRTSGERGTTIVGYNDILKAIRYCLVSRSGKCGEIDNRDIHDCANNPSIIQDIHDGIVEEIIKNQILNDRLFMTKSRRATMAGWVGSFLQKSSEKRGLKVGTTRMASRKERTGFVEIEKDHDSKSYKIDSLKTLELPPAGAAWDRQTQEYIFSIFTTEDRQITITNKQGKKQFFPKAPVDGELLKNNLILKSPLLFDLNKYIDDIENNKERILLKLEEEKNNMLDANNRVIKWFVSNIEKVAIESQETTKLLRSLNLLKEELIESIINLYDSRKELVNNSDTDSSRANRMLERSINVGVKTIKILSNDIFKIIEREGAPPLDKDKEILKQAKNIINPGGGGVINKQITAINREKESTIVKNVKIWGVYLKSTLLCLKDPRLLKAISHHIGTGRLGKGQLGYYISLIRSNLSEYTKLPFQEILGADEANINSLVREFENYYNQITSNFERIKSEEL